MAKSTVLYMKGILISLRRENNTSEERGICRTSTDASAKYVSVGIGYFEK